MEQYWKRRIIISGIISLVAGLLAAWRIRFLAFDLAVAVLVFGILIGAQVLVRYLQERAERRRDPTRMEMSDLFADCRRVLGQIGQMTSDPAFEKARPAGVRRMRLIEDKLREIFEALQKDDDKHEAARLFLPGYLQPFHREVQTYYRLATREIKAAGEELDLSDRVMDETLVQLNELFERIHSTDINTLAAMNEMMGSFMDAESFPVP